MQRNFPYHSEIKALLFDKDGTLFDFHETWRPVMDRAAAYASGGDETLAEALLAAGGYDPASRRFLPDSIIASGHAGELADLWRRLGAVFDTDTLRCGLDRIFAAESLHRAVPVTDLRRLFAGLSRQGFLLGIATNDSLASASAAVQRFGLEDVVRFVAGYDSGYGAKPGPGMASAFCAAVGLPPRNVAIVGDSEHDMAMGRSAGLGACIGVLTGAGTMATLSQCADMVLKDVSELAERDSERN
ncbi:HAD family hydrolase [Desulfonatronum parangueonense]